MRRKKPFLILLSVLTTTTLAFAQPISVSLPVDATGNSGTAVTIPITVGDLTNRNVIAYQVLVSFNESVLDATGASSTGTLSELFGPPTVNTLVNGQITVGGFGTSPLSGSGTLVNLQFNVVGQAGNMTDLVFVSFIFNAGDPSAVTSNGKFTIPPGVVTHSIALNTGWNLVSFAVTPEGSQNMLDILTPILGNLVKVIDEQGRSIVKLLGNWNNSIGNWSATEGYYIKVNQAVTLGVTGMKIVPPLPLPLNTGWNIISYPCYESAQNALTVVQPLINTNQLVKVIDEQGRTIVKLLGNWTNSIGNMQSGEGYYVKVNASSTLDMTCGGAASVSKASNPVEFSKPKHFSSAIVGHPFEPMNIFVVDASVNGLGLLVGDELAVYDGEQCVGVGVINEPLSSNSPLELIASKDDGSGRGFREGHDMSFRLWQSRTGEEIAVDANALRFFDSSTGKATMNSMFESFGTAALAIDLRTTAVAANEQIPATYRLYPNHPNPFNPSTMISYDLPEATEVRLEIYDLTGNLIKRLYEGKQSAGRHVIEWDGTNELGTKVVSGIHFYRLVTSKYVETRKMILVK